MQRLLFITHPEVVVDPAVPVTDWRLSDAGLARMRAFCRGPEARGVGAVWSSPERKAVQAAGLFAEVRGLEAKVDPDLGENDRSATGYLPAAAFEQVADAFFARPDQSVRGWERAVDAQARVRGAVARIVAQHRGGDLAIVAHGAVGALMLCALRGAAISRTADQPFQGNFWAARLPDLALLHGWRPIAPR